MQVNKVRQKGKRRKMKRPKGRKCSDTEREERKGKTQINKLKPRKGDKLAKKYR